MAAPQFALLGYAIPMENAIQYKDFKACSLKVVATKKKKKLLPFAITYLKKCRFSLSFRTKTKPRINNIEADM